MSLDAAIYVPSFIKFGSGIQKLIGRDSQAHRQHGDRISLFTFFQTTQGSDKLKEN
jgi:hypothetical protein